MKWFRSSGKTEDYEKEDRQKPKQKKNISKDKKSKKKEQYTLSTKLKTTKQEYRHQKGNLTNAQKK